MTDATVTWIQLITGAILFAGVIASAVVYVVSQVRRTNADELEQLAETRAERIEDLEGRIDRYESRLANLEGKISAIEEIKAQQIADKVIGGLIEGGHLRQ